jgi:hypothetical protein
MEKYVQQDMWFARDTVCEQIIKNVKKNFFNTEARNNVVLLLKQAQCSTWPLRYKKMRYVNKKY